MMADVAAHRVPATCYALQGTMADGTKVRRRSVASNVLPLGTKIRLVGRQSFYGLRVFYVRDTGSALGDGHLDFWHPSRARCISWGRRHVAFRVVPHGR